MFTGIIKEIGKVKNIEKTDKFWKFKVETTNILEDKNIGESISVNGVCVTITKISKQNFTFDLIPETLEITNLKNLKISDLVNLEAALRLHQSLDGHLVQGHVDTTGKVIKLKEKDNKIILTIQFPEKIAKYLALRGSITINGVSLTISDLKENNLSVELIPHTLEKTNLKNLKKDDFVNIETDLIAKHLDRLLNKKEGEAKYSYLLERNLL